MIVIILVKSLLQFSIIIFMIIIIVMNTITGSRYSPPQELTGHPMKKPPMLRQKGCDNALRGSSSSSSSCFL